jgi:tuberculosinol/isotuberculosinol synthase
MNLETFQELSTAEVARLARQSGPKVCVFPINGTRRWFMLEHAPQPEEDWNTAYLQAAIHSHIELYQLLFDHGLDTLLTPCFGPDILERGQDYMGMAAQGLGCLASHPDFLEFYDTCQVRVRFYGDYRRYFGATPYAYLIDIFDQVTEGTAHHDQHRLFFGLFANDATQTIAELAVAYHAQHGHIPDRRTLVELYYGEYVEPVDLFIGFDKCAAFDMPLLATGFEDLYFTVCPSPYLDGRQLRAILYDHLYARRGEPEYSALAPGDWSFMADFYRTNRGRTLGVGTQREGIWYPLTQIGLPVESIKSESTARRIS